MLNLVETQVESQTAATVTDDSEDDRPGIPDSLVWARKFLSSLSPEAYAHLEVRT